ncbi:MAG TPA: hypothetical protein VI522_00390 [Gammaproteobacteria bacterium]|nr:hypothetical protein [Gammaproteobacteria bacterium]
MSGFCTDCSQRLFGDPGDDFEGLSSPEDNAKGIFTYVYCEGCKANIFVDHSGARVSGAARKTGCRTCGS